MSVVVKYLLALWMLINIGINLTHGDEICEPYLGEDGSTVIEAYNCTSQLAGSFCCGDCGRRYCCSNVFEKLDQEACLSDKLSSRPNPFITQKTQNSGNYDVCQMYIDSARKLVPERECDANNSYCCGSCRKRYCCPSPALRMDQDDCPSSFYTETCESHTNSYGYFISNQRCPVNSRYCCGSCKIRYCCSSFTARLNQYSCKYNPTTSKAKSTVFFYSFLLISLFIFILIFVGICYLNKFKKPRRQARSSLRTREGENNVTLNTITSINETPAHTLTKTTASYENDLPPSYNQLYQLNTVAS